MTSPPRHYFLNDAHELAHSEKSGGGGTPKFGHIDWAQRGQVLAKTLVSARAALEKSPDPTVPDRLFLLASPVPAVPKLSDNKKKHPTGKFDEKPSFAGQDSLVFRRLGMDLVDVSPSGEAVVHVPRQRIEKLLQTTAALDKEGLREQARWAALDRFDVVPIEHKVDAEWLKSLKSSEATEAVIRLHSMLNRMDVERVISRVRESILGPGEELVRVGRTFSGRPWVLALLRPRSIERIAKEYSSVQAIHPPLVTEVDGPSRRPSVGAKPVSPVAPTVSHSALPVVAVLDSGIPKNHQLLAPFIRARYVGRNSGAGVDGHGSLVASRIVYGEVDFYGGIDIPPPGRVAVVDVAVADLSQSTATRAVIQDEDVVDAMASVVAGNPEVRVFNLSFSGPPLSQLPEVEQTQRLLLAQDLDNFIFANDVIVVMSAGNSLAGMLPNDDYPKHLDDPRWEMGGWVTGVNTLKCGAYVGHPVSSGVVNTVGWPSPFTKVGPPVSNAAAPEFSATGGDLDSNYRQVAGGGVWCCDETGQWIDVPGTSFSAPLLAREAALMLEHLRIVAGRPFASLVRAALVMTARRRGERTYSKDVLKLADRTLGRGFPDAAAIPKPVANRGLVFWQGVLESAGDIARVQLPLPKAWLSKAGEPRLRLVVAWDPPVNHAATEIWSCRELSVQLKPSASSAALTGKTARRGSSPTIERNYDLSAERLTQKKVDAVDDMWLVEIHYEDKAAYPAGVTVSPTQRVAFVAELADTSQAAVPPHEAIQQLKLAQSMTQLTAVPLPVPATLLVTVK